MGSHTSVVRHKKKYLPLSMKLRFFYDFIMFVIFMTMYGLYSPFVATYALLGMSMLKMGITLAGKEKVKLLDWVEFSFLTVFCIATLALHQAFFIQVKAPLLSVLFVGGMIAYSLNTKESFMRNLFEKDFKIPPMPEDTWKKIDHMVIANLLIKAAIVFTIIFGFSDTVWFYSNFVLPAFDLTMMAGIYLTARPHFQKNPALDIKPIQPLRVSNLVAHARTFTPQPMLILLSGFRAVRGNEGGMSSASLHDGRISPGSSPGR